MGINKTRNFTNLPKAKLSCTVCILKFLNYYLSWWHISEYIFSISYAQRKKNKSSTYRNLLFLLIFQSVPDPSSYFHRTFVPPFFFIFYHLLIQSPLWKNVHLWNKPIILHNYDVFVTKCFKNIYFLQFYTFLNCFDISALV